MGLIQSTSSNSLKAGPQCGHIFVDNRTTHNCSNSSLALSNVMWEVYKDDRNWESQIGFVWVRQHFNKFYPLFDKGA